MPQLLARPTGTVCEDIVKHKILDCSGACGHHTGSPIVSQCPIRHCAFDQLVQFILKILLHLRCGIDVILCSVVQTLSGFETPSNTRNFCHRRNKLARLANAPFLKPQFINASSACNQFICSFSVHQLVFRANPSEDRYRSAKRTTADLLELLFR